jgi:hypothetical protein
MADGATVPNDRGPLMLDSGTAVPRSSPSAGRTLTVLVTGTLRGGAAAVLAGSVLTAQAAEEALAIDRAAALPEAAATVQASLDHAGLVIAAAPDRQGRAVRSAEDDDRCHGDDPARRTGRYPDTP